MKLMLLFKISTVVRIGKDKLKKMRMKLMLPALKIFIILTVVLVRMQSLFSYLQGRQGRNMKGNDTATQMEPSKCQLFRRPYLK